MRAVFKIIRISADKLSVHLDLRDLPPKALNLNYGCQDVQWNPKEGIGSSVLAQIFEGVIFANLSEIRENIICTFHRLTCIF